mmetsp:Transcript_53240/g.143559  ORF Transcript_53240/g.143559 Transcript_53240/m.143559 type:complete len:241 (-) Transcript_53240:523-1245(-)
MDVRRALLAQVLRAVHLPGFDRRLLLGLAAGAGVLIAALRGVARAHASVGLQDRSLGAGHLGAVLRDGLWRRLAAHLGVHRSARVALAELVVGVWHLHGARRAGHGVAGHPRLRGRRHLRVAALVDVLLAADAGPAEAGRGSGLEDVVAGACEVCALARLLATGIVVVAGARRPRALQLVRPASLVHVAGAGVGCARRLRGLIGLLTADEEVLLDAAEALFAESAAGVGLRFVLVGALHV